MAGVTSKGAHHGTGATAMSFARLELVEDVRVVHLEGCAADDLGDALATLVEHHGPTVLDLAELTMVGRVEEVVGELVARCDAIGLVVRRRTAREILRRSGIAERCEVFPTVADALDALSSDVETAR